MGFTFLWDSFSISVCSAIPFPCSGWTPLCQRCFALFYLWERPHYNLWKSVTNRCHSRNNLCFILGRHSRERHIIAFISDPMSFKRQQKGRGLATLKPENLLKLIKIVERSSDFGVFDTGSFRSECKCSQYFWYIKKHHYWKIRNFSYPWKNL